MIAFRRYESGDELRPLHEATEAAVGHKMDLPDLGEHPVLVAEVAEKNGAVIGGFYLESVPECCFIGRDAEVTVSAVRHAPEVLSRLRDFGFRVVRIQVPKSLPETERGMIRGELEKVGFHCTDSLYEHYCCDMRKRDANG